MHKVIVLLLLGLATACTALPSDSVSIRSKVKRAIVKVSYEEGMGSGFFYQYGMDTVLVSNAHVCKDKDTVLTISSDEGGIPSFTSKALVIDYDKDVCLIKINTDAVPQTLVARGGGLVRGMKAFIVGHPGGRALTVNEATYTGRTIISIGYPAYFCDKSEGTRVSSLFGEFCLKHMNTVEVDGTLRGGNSGGAFVDGEGRLIAVAFARADGIGSGVPLDDLNKVVKQYLLNQLPQSK